MTILKEDLIDILKSNLQELEDIDIPYAKEQENSVHISKFIAEIADTESTLKGLDGIHQLEIDYYLKNHCKEGESILNATSSIVRMLEERKKYGFVIN